MEPFGDQFLAGPTLTDDQYRTVQFGGPRGALNRVEKRTGLSDKLVVALHAQIMAYFTNISQQKT